MEPVSIIDVNLDLEEHERAVRELIDSYASDPMGLGAALPDDVGPNMVTGLRACPTSVLFLAYSDGEPIGLAVCFVAFSTFAAKPLLNVHDLIVLPQFRRRGVASQILAHAERHARQQGCCKITLEVRRDNLTAQALYRKSGFGSGSPPYEFWTKPLPSSV